MRCIERAKLPRDFQTALDEIVSQIRAGAGRWEPPWVGGDAPRNLQTKLYYSGINQLILMEAARNYGFSHHRWGTAKQIAAIGGGLREGARGVTTVFGTRYFSKGGTRSRGMGRLHTVYNVADCIGLPPLPVPPAITTAHCLPRLERLVRATGADIHEGGTSANYCPAHDDIRVPPRAAFYDPKFGWARALLHGLAHWAEHPSRLNPGPLADDKHQNRALGEIAAELAAAFVSRRLDIPATGEHAAYIADWLQQLRSLRRVVEADPLWVLETVPHALATARFLLRFATRPDFPPPGRTKPKK